MFNRCVQEMWALILSPWEQINAPCLKNERGDQLFSKYIPQTFMVLKMWRWFQVEWETGWVDFLLPCLNQDRATSRSSYRSEFGIRLHLIKEHFCMKKFGNHWTRWFKDLSSPNLTEEKGILTGKYVYFD